MEDKYFHLRKFLSYLVIFVDICVIIFMVIAALEFNRDFEDAILLFMFISLGVVNIYFIISAYKPLFKIQMIRKQTEERLKIKHMEDQLKAMR